MSVDVATWNETVRRLAAYERQYIVEHAAAAMRAGELAAPEEVDAGFRE